MQHGRSSVPAQGDASGPEPMAPGSDEEIDEYFDWKIGHCIRNQVHATARHHRRQPRATPTRRARRETPRATLHDNVPTVTSSRNFSKLTQLYVYNYKYIQYTYNYIHTPKGRYVGKYSLEEGTKCNGLEPMIWLFIPDPRSLFSTSSLTTNKMHSIGRAWYVSDATECVHAQTDQEVVFFIIFQWWQFAPLHNKFYVLFIYLKRYEIY